MLAASKGTTLIYRSKAKVGISAFIKNSRWQNCNLVEGNLYAKRMIWSSNTFLNGYLLLSQSPRGFKNPKHVKHISTMSVGIPWIWPFFMVLSSSICNYKFLGTQASPSEVEVTDETINNIISTVKKDPSSARDLCTTHIDNFWRARKLSAATRLFHALHHIHIFLSPHAYNLLLAVAVSENDVDLLSQVFKDFLVSGERMSSASFLNLAKGFSKITDSVPLLQLVKEVSELTFPINVTFVNRIIFAFSDCGQVDKSILIFDQMKSLKCKPNLVTYNTILGILGSIGRVDEMLIEFVSMKEANIIPDIVSYNTLINSLRKVGKLDLCLVYLKEMLEGGIKLDLRTYTALIDMFGKSGNIEESLKLFDDMKHRQIRPSIYIYRSLINNLRKMGKLELARIFLDEMNKRGSDLVGPEDFKRKHR